MSFTDVQVTQDATRWEAIIAGRISAEALNGERSAVLKDFNKQITLKGFRAGHAPESEIVKHVGEGEIVRRSAERIIQRELPHVLAEKKLNIVDAPQVSLKPEKNGYSFEARAPRAPSITLPDYKKIAARVNAQRTPVDVSDSEHQDALTHLRRERARMAHIEGGVAPAEAFEKATSAKGDDLPQLDEQFAKEIGFADLTAFTTQFRAQMVSEKKVREDEKHRATLLDAIAKEAKVSYPALLDDYELKELEARLEHDLARMGKTLEEYVKETNASLETVRKNLSEAAKKRAVTRLILADIANKEHIEAEETQIAHEVEHTRAHYKDKDVDDNTLRAHIVHALRNQKVLAWLESRGEEKN